MGSGTSPKPIIRIQYYALTRSSAEFILAALETKMDDDPGSLKLEQ
jgi:hypothetical protein